MIFSSFEFIFFFFILLVLLYLFRCAEDNRKKEIIIIASYFFYGCWDYKALALVLTVTLGNYWLGGLVGVNKPKKKLFLWMSIIFNLSMLGYFKYYNFFIDSLSVIFPISSHPLAGFEIILPIGISFYIFQAMTYPIDIYEHRLEPTNLRDFSFFVAFFPKLIMGPITSASQFIPQLSRPIKLTKANLTTGVSLFLIGLVKKTVFANSLAIFVNEVFAHYVLYDSWSLFCAAISYSIQIYCDFSGYSDMAIGIALILGFALPVNFNYPYKSCSITDFWRRWHISLSTWLKNYLYIPLGGNRKGKRRTYINLFITFFLCGLWHGAGLNYILWGIYHGIGLISHKLWLSVHIQSINRKHGKNNSVDQSRLRMMIAIFMTYIFVSLGWILFRSPTFDDAWSFILRMVTGVDGIQWIHISFYLITPFFIIWHWFPDQNILRKKFVRFDTLLGLWVSVAMIMMVLLFSPLGSSPFIYFQF